MRKISFLLQIISLIIWVQISTPFAAAQDEPDAGAAAADSGAAAAEEGAAATDAAGGNATDGNGTGNGTDTGTAVEKTTLHPPMGKIVQSWFHTILSYFPYFNIPRFHWTPVYKKPSPPKDEGGDTNGTGDGGNGTAANGTSGEGAAGDGGAPAGEGGAPAEGGEAAAEEAASARH